MTIERTEKIDFSGTIAGVILIIIYMPNLAE
jgi:hypothetical protein